jgi:poly [ADP-ribose] polymerase 2/3/4
MVVGGASLSAALNEFDKKFKDKSGLRWDDRMDKPKSGVSAQQVQT